MGYIIINDDKDREMDGVRSNMRRTMMRGGSTAMMRHHDDRDMHEHYYRMGYKHGVEDWEDEHDEHYRRMRDSRGRYI